MAYIFKPNFHPGQLQVYNDPHKHKVIAAGKGWGKTDMVTKSGAGLALTKGKSFGAIIAPFAKQALYDYNIIRKLIPRDRIEKTSEKWLTLTLKNETEISMFSAENPEAARGFAWDWAIVDEAAFCDTEIFPIIDSQIGKRNGVCWYISTPWGKGKFYDLYTQEQKDPDHYKSFHFTTYDNPYYPREEIERMRLSMSDVEFRQEVLAEFLEGGIVFPHLAEVMTAVPREPIPGHHYVTGADLGKALDFTAIKTFDIGDNNEVYKDRFTQRDWSFVKTAIYSHCKRYNNSTLVIDATGVGASVVEDLQKMDRATPDSPKQGHLTVVPIVFSAKFKPIYFSNYITAHDNRTIRLLPDPVTKQEHEDLLSVKLQGTTQYKAPKGKHEDTVIAAVLAVWGLEKICGSSTVCGPFTDEEIGRKPRVPIDPSKQIDTDAIIRSLETKQVAGTFYDDDQNIVPSYDDRI